MKYIISLPAYEKDLLSELVQLFQLADPNVTSGLNEAAIDALRVSLFTHWSWADSVREYLQDSLSESSETLIEDFDGDRRTAYADSLHWLANGGGSQQALFRVHRMDKENPEFIARLEDKPIDKVEFVPAETDAQFWTILAQACMISGFPAPEAAQVTLFKRSSYDMWKLIHQLAVCILQPENFQHVTDHFVTQPIFRSRYVFKEDPSSSKQIDNPEAWGHVRALQVFDRDSLKALEMINSQQASSSTLSPLEDEKKDKLISYLRKLGDAQPMDDPRTYLHFIPWQELQALEKTKWEERGLLNTEEMLENNHSMWVIWKAPAKTPKLLHHIHTEDEVAQYCLQKNWTFPGHSDGGSVVLRVNSIARSGFIEDIKHFWESWNECAITQNPINEELLLLETISGIQWRRLKQQQDIEAARTYFRNVVENHANRESALDVLRPTLGNHYSPKYENLLRLIPESEIMDVQAEPLGEGVNGAVYAATWNRPPGYLTTTNSVQKIPIVLKQILSKYGEEEIQRKLIQELHVTFTALDGSMLGCVPLLGLTTAGSRASKSDRRDDSHKTQPHPNTRLQLVFERASEGSLLASARKQLEDAQGSKSWMVLIDVLNSIASGLNTLHKHQVVHRDLHPNNVLATKKYFPTNPKFKSEVKYLISDIGEGENLSERELDVVGVSMGAKQFRAPEIHGGRGWTVKADVFAFSVLACKMLDLRAQVCGDAHEVGDSGQQELRTHSYSIPERLKEPLEGCMSREADQRPSMRNVIRILDDFSADLLSKEPVMVTWDWNKTLADMRVGGSEWPRADSDDGSLASIFVSEPFFS